jgi:pimeloyl-ACP methyl ester carboxylesterase
MKLFYKSALLLLGAVVFFGGAGLVATWAPDRPVSELTARWAQPPSKFIAVQGLQVHVRDEGPRDTGGPGMPDNTLPIVLLHGTSASLHNWEGWAKELRGERRVVRFDLPGFALTGPNAQNDYSIEAYVKFVTAMVDTLGIQRFVVAGNSLGGQIAWATASALPDRVARLILVDASGYGVDPKNAPLGFVLAGTPVVRELMAYTLPRGVVQNTVRSVYGNPEKVTPELVDLYVDMTLRAGNRRALSRRIDQGYSGDVAQIKALKLPTLILWGGRDRLIPPEHGQRFASDIANSKLVVFEDLGHVPQEEDPARTVAEVKRFLAN